MSLILSHVQDVGAKVCHVIDKLRNCSPSGCTNKAKMYPHLAAKKILMHMSICKHL
ncbi:hypothetical protein Bca101_064806 [Brassica carinata]